MATTFNSEQLTLTSSVVQTFDDAKVSLGGQQAIRAIISISSGEDVRMRMGADPTSSIGVILQRGADPFTLDGFDAIDDVRFISTGGAGSVLDVVFVLV